VEQRNKENLVILNGIPIIMPRRNAERLLQIEVWIESGALLGELEKELGIQKPSKLDNAKEYIV
jgi:hypothetical protein